MATEHGRLWSEVVVDVAYAGKVLNMEKNAVYKAVGRGDIPSIKIGNRFRIPTAPLRQMLGLTEQDAPRKGSIAA